MNHVEQSFSVLQRRLMVASNVAHLADLDVKAMAFIARGNETAHPFNSSGKSFEKTLAKVEAVLRAAP